MQKRVAFLAVTALLLSTAAPGQEIRQGVDALTELLASYTREHERRILQDFSELLSLPNVATDLAAMERNAEHIARMLSLRGFVVRTLDGGGPPYIYAELTSEGADSTVLLYAHYDGQPVLEDDWAYPPFSPTLLDAPLQAGGRPVDIAGHTGSFGSEWRLYARSAGDDKLPIIAILHALDALAASDVPLAVNLKLLLDGEEEQGSPTLGRVLDEYGDLLDADLMLFCDGPMHQSRRSQLLFGARGAMTVDLTAYGPLSPLHSGHYGNWAPNPIARLAHLLASMRDESGRILIDGYHDDVVPLTPAERLAIDAMPDISSQLRNELAIRAPEGNGTRLEELITLPALNARGIAAGAVGELGSNVIPASATLSLDLRLVPDQEPARIRALVEAHIAAQGHFVVHEAPSPAIRLEHDSVIEVDWRGFSVPPLRTAFDDSAVEPLIALMREIAPDLILTPTSGGTLPLYEFGARFTTPIVILPLANHDNNQHAENENIRLRNIWDAIAVYGVLLAAYRQPLAEQADR